MTTKFKLGLPATAICVVMMTFFNIANSFAQAPEIIDLELDDRFHQVVQSEEIDDTLYFVSSNKPDSMECWSFNTTTKTIIKYFQGEIVLQKDISTDPGYRFTSWIYLKKNEHNELIVFFIEGPLNSNLVGDSLFNPNIHDNKLIVLRMDSDLNIYEKKTEVIYTNFEEEECITRDFLFDVDYTVAFYTVASQGIPPTGTIKFYRMDLNDCEIMYQKSYRYTDFDQASMYFLLHNADSSGYYFISRTIVAFLDKDFNKTGVTQIDASSFPHNLFFSIWEHTYYVQSPDGSIYAAGSCDYEYGYPYRTLQISKINDTLSLEKFFFGPRPKYLYDYAAWYIPVDLITSDRIFFAGMLAWDNWNPYNHSYWVLYCFNAELNVIQEYYYHHEGDPEQDLWSIKATSDGGCVLIGRYRSDYTYYNNLILKFPPEAFVGIEEAHESGLSVAIAYPNPGGDKMCIRTAVPNAEVEVFDINGRRVAKQHLQDKETVLNATAWQSGTYLWRVYSEGKMVETGKWVRL